MDSSDNNNNKQPVPKPAATVEDELDILDKALEGTDDPLNLTADESVDDGEIDPKVEEELNNIFKGMSSGGDTGNPGIDGIAQMMSKILGEFKDPTNADPNNPNPNNANPGEKELTDMFEKLLGGGGKPGEGGDFDGMAQQLLKQFMDKDVLFEPLQEAEKSYVEYLEKNGTTISADDKKRFEAQLNCVKELIQTLDKEPDNKDKMITLFEQMHDHGDTPPGVLNPLNKMGGFPGMPMPGMAAGMPSGMGGMPGMPGMGSPEDMKKMMGEDQCNIF
jgi:peroxin-19